MNSKTAGYLILYGGFLIVLGLLGYLSNPEKAKTALMTGGTFGALSILWGVLGARGFGWSRFAALATTIMMIAAFGGRSIHVWLAVLEGQSEKRFAASLITLMLAASIAVLIGLIKALKTSPAETNRRRKSRNRSRFWPLKAKPTGRDRE